MRLSEGKSINASHKICQLPFPRLQPDKQLTLNNKVCCEIYRVGQKKWGHRLMAKILSNLNRLKFFFTVRFPCKFLVKWILTIPPHVAYVSKCETLMSVKQAVNDVPMTIPGKYKWLRNVWCVSQSASSRKRARTVNGVLPFEVQRAQNGVRYLRRWQLAPPHRQGSLRSAVSSVGARRDPGHSITFLDFEVSGQLILLRFPGKTAAEVPQSGGKRGCNLHTGASNYQQEGYQRAPWRYAANCVPVSVDHELCYNG